MDERTVVNPATGAEMTMSEALTHDPEEIRRVRAERKAKLAQVLERGQVADRLEVPLPEDVYGEWVVNDKAEIHRMEVLGFTVDKTYAKKRALHDEGDDRSIVGDVVFMTCDRETHDLIEEVRREKYAEMNSKQADQDAENKEFSTQVDRKLGMPVIEESSSRRARKADIEAAISAAKSKR